MRTRHIALGLLVAALLVPASAQARWGPTQDIAPLAGTSGFAYDGNARGERVLVWEAGGGTLMFAQARKGRPFGSPRFLATGSGSNFGPRVELDELGNALVVFNYFDGTRVAEPELRGGGTESCCDGLRATVILRDGKQSRVTDLGPKGADASLLDMQIASDGRLGVIYAVQAPGEGPMAEARFGRVTKGVNGGREEARGVPGLGPVALSFVRGRARVLYATSAGTGGDSEPAVFRERERRAFAKWSGARSVGSATLVRGSIRFATSPRGEQAVTWMRASPNDPLLAQAVYAGARGPDGRFRFRKLGSESAFNVAAVAIEPTGNALTAWDSARRSGIAAALRRPRAAFGGLTTMNSFEDPTDLGLPAVDVNARGHGLLAWSERPLGGTARLVGAFRNSRGSALEHHVIDPQWSAFGVHYSVSLDRAGRGEVAYRSNGRLQVIAARIGG